MTTRLWDLRYPATSFAVLKAHIGAIRALRFRCERLLLCVPRTVAVDRASIRRLPLSRVQGHCAVAGRLVSHARP